MKYAHYRVYDREGGKVISKNFSDYLETMLTDSERSGALESLEQLLRAHLVFTSRLIGLLMDKKQITIEEIRGLLKADNLLAINDVNRYNPLIEEK